MPKSEAPDSERAKAKPHRAPRQRAHSTDLGQTALTPAAGMQELQRPEQSLLDNDFSQHTFERHVAQLGDSRFSQPMYAGHRATIVRQLQRNYGNRYVQRLVDHISRMAAEAVQAKLTVGPAGDKYEQEADRVAKQVMEAVSSTG